MKLKKREEPQADPDMTPMIDMVFLLLIFFMVAATMSQIDLTPELELAVAPKASVPDDMRNRGTVNVLGVGMMTPGGEPTSEKQPFMVSGKLVDDKGLTQVIEERLSENPELRIYMRVDKEVDFKYVRRGIKACAAAGAYDLIFATYQSSGGG